MRSPMERGMQRRLELLLRVWRARGHAPRRALERQPTAKTMQGGGKETDFLNKDDEPSSNSK